MKETKTTERWVPAKYIQENGTILDFTSLYEVSDIGGRVRSLWFGKVRVLKQYTSHRNGAIWNQVGLHKDNKTYYLSVHRLVLSSFVPEGFRPGAVVNHIEARSEICDNSLANLEWTTQKDNVNTEHCRELQSKAQTNHPAKSKRVKVTDLTTGETNVYPSTKEAGRSLGINPDTPASCINDKKRKGYYKKRNLRFEYIK